MNAAYAISPFKVFIVLSLLITWMIRRILKVGRREPLLPPGPGTTPILGNITILPKKDAYLQFGEWAKQYGEIFSLKVSSKTIVVLSSPDAVIHVMEKNGAITSDKPSAAHRPRIFGENGILAGIQYGPLYRTWRKVANEMFGRSACQRHTPTQLAETSQLMLNLLDHPEEIFDEIERAVLSLKLSVFFGTRPTSASSPERKSSIALRRVYSSCQLQHWKRKCDELKCLQEDLWGGLAARAEKKVEAGIQTGSFYEQVLGRASEWNIDRKTIRNMAAIYVMSATHTTTTTLRWFIILVTVYPHAQEKLREEIDRVVGQDRLPSPEDMPNLPYLHAFIREV
ncbi:hypothetical protein FRC03_004040 [Tulasnella sp. 419]|nr:hypothetical protein FRC03_004040 [Tulasnella sp. 419]